MFHISNGWSLLDVSSFTYAWWNIVIGLRVLLIMYYLIKILVEAVLDVYVRDVQLKVFHSRYCYDASSAKTLLEKYVCWFAHGEPYVPDETMVEKMVTSTSSSSNMHEVINDNNNCYRSMIMDAMRINYSYASECSIVNEEPNAYITSFFFLTFERFWWTIIGWVWK